jgi:hypothetical protein
MCYRRLLPPSLMVRSVDGRDDELINVVVLLLLRLMGKRASTVGC